MEGSGRLAAELTIITTDPNTVMEQAHDRMPVILAAKDYEEWLDRSDSAAMKMHHAHPKVGNVRNQGLEMLNSE